jgi:hypothetical protein
MDTEVAHFFDASSIPNGEPPTFAVLMGGVAAGKTTMREQRFSTGYVLVDAAEIFLNLSRGEYFPFPGHLEEPMEKIGRCIAKRAIAERRSIVTELIGGDVAPTQALLQAMAAIGYETDLHGLTCDLDVALQRNANRGDGRISAYYAEPYQRRWLFDAARAAATIHRQIQHERNN